jgi:hypothetical protein
MKVKARLEPSGPDAAMLALRHDTSCTASTVALLLAHKCQLNLFDPGFFRRIFMNPEAAEILQIIMRHGQVQQQSESGQLLASRVFEEALLVR